MQKAPRADATLTLGKTATGEDNYFEWKAVVTGPVRDCERRGACAVAKLLQATVGARVACCCFPMRF